MEIKLTREVRVREVSTTIHTEDDGDGGIEFVTEDSWYLFRLTREGVLVLHADLESEFFQTDDEGYIVVERD